MKSAIVLVVASTALTALAQPTPTTVEPATTIEWRFVGYTQTVTNGEVRVGASGGIVGYPAMHALCASEVAVNARACFTSEITRSLLPNDPLWAWAIPSDLSLVYDPTVAPGFDWVVQDIASGLTAAGSEPKLATDAFTCSGFRSDNPTSQGPALIGSALSLLECGEPLRIACCAPKAIPVSP